MTNPYQPPRASKKRVFKTPIVVPLSVVAVILIYAGYAIFFVTREAPDVSGLTASLAFPVFLLCEIGLITIIVFNKRQLDGFHAKYPRVDSVAALEALKPIARTNMYSALFSFTFMGLGALTAIMTILNAGMLKAGIVVLLSIAVALAIRWYNASEERIKQIESNEALEPELTRILQCWIHKALPDF